MRTPLEAYTLERAAQMIARGLPLAQVAKTLGVSRASLYNHGLRSTRGYTRQ